MIKRFTCLLKSVPVKQEVSCNVILPLWTKLLLSDYSFKTLKGPSKKESSENFKLLGSVLSSSGLGRNSKESQSR